MKKMNNKMNNNTKPALVKPVVRIACTVQGCDFAMPESIALVPSIDAMQRLDGTDGRIAPISALKIAAHVVCPRCGREIRHAVPEVVFFNYLGTLAEVARRLKARAEREAAEKAVWKAERKAGLKTAIGAFAGLSPKDGVKTTGSDGRKLVGAAANAVVRKAITKIAPNCFVCGTPGATEADPAGRGTVCKPCQAFRLRDQQERATKKAGLDARNSAMTLAAIGGKQ